MQPTAPELEILKLLWQQEPRTARELHDAIRQHYPWSYSSTRKTLERMGEKALVVSASSGHRRIYRANVDKVMTLARFAQDFAERVLELKGPLPIATFSGSQLVDDEEIADLEKLLKDLAAETDELNKPSDDAPSEGGDSDRT